uniref:Odorant receptor n=1 Tax=Conogethes pinicolalis TaxID=1178461 RepID=A0A5B9GB64_9NEOP|nr:odorant receptor 31 [Conogethes pinicolalis]
MNLLLQNSFWSLRLTLSVLYWTGFYIPKGNAANKSSYILPLFSFMFMVGIYVIAQFGDLCQVWGDVALMTGTSFLLFTNLSLGTKMFNLVWRKVEIGAMVAEADEELTAEDTNGGKEIIKRYPYDTSKSPAYELTYIHQIVAVSLGATVNVSLDFLVTSLMAQCNCRLRLLALRLRTLGEDFVVNDQMLFSIHQVQVVTDRLYRCIERHQSVLETAARLQKAYSASILVQVTVSMVIICVTAYQLAFATQDLVRFVSMLAYFACMTLQLFLYCYQGNQLSEESIQVAEAAYEMPWYRCTSSFRRDLLMLMTRSRRVSKITAAGFTTLSLSAFMAIIKASYTFFTVLRSVDN